MPTRSARSVLPDLLDTVRASPLPVFHVVGGGEYYQDEPGLVRTRELAGPSPAPAPTIEPDPVLLRLRKFRHDHVFPGAHNAADVGRGVDRMGFAAGTGPLAGEMVAEDTHQLFALCAERGINHLLYASAKELALWRVAVEFGFVIDVPDLLSALRQPVVRDRSLRR